MTSISEVHKRCMALTLKYLENQRECMHKAVNDYVNVVIDAAKQWAEREDEHTSKYLLMIQMIDNAAEFVSLKHSEISESAKDEALQFSRLLAGDPDLASEIIGQMLSASTGATKEQTVMPKCSTDNALTSLQCATGNFATRQTDASRNREQIPLRETDVGAMVNNVTSKIWKKLEKNESLIKKMAAELERSQKLAAELHVLKEDLQELSENKDSTRHNLKKQFKNLSANQNKLENLKMELQKLASNKNKLQDEISSKINDDLEKKLSALSNETESLKEFMMSAIEKNDSFMEELSSRTESTENVTADLSEKVSKINETLSSLGNVLI